MCAISSLRLHRRGAGQVTRHSPRGESQLPQEPLPLPRHGRRSARTELAPGRVSTLPEYAGSWPVTDQGVRRILPAAGSDMPARRSESPSLRLPPTAALGADQVTRHCAGRIAVAQEHLPYLRMGADPRGRNSPRDEQAPFRSTRVLASELIRALEESRLAAAGGHATLAPGRVKSPTSRPVQARALTLTPALAPARARTNSSRDESPCRCGLPSHPDRLDTERALAPGPRVDEIDDEKDGARDTSR
jgi:hypothetical protein